MKNETGGSPARDEENMMIVDTAGGDPLGGSIQQVQSPLVQDQEGKAFQSLSPNAGARNQPIGTLETEITQSQPYNKNMSLDDLGGKVKVLSEKEIMEKEQEHSAELASKMSKLEELQKQEPPKNKEDLVQYLMLRLRAAEDSIVVAEDVIEQERNIRKSSNKDMKEQIHDLNSMISKEKKNLQEKVTAELDFTLKQAVKEKHQIKDDLNSAQQEKDELQKEYDDLVEMYNDMKEASK